MPEQTNASIDTPPDSLPAILDREIALGENALTVLRKRYLLRGPDGEPAETPAQMFWRVARVVAAPDVEYGGEARTTARAFYDLLTSFRFMPNSPTFTGAGTPLGQLAACFVLPIKDDMGRDPAGIFATLRVAALIQQTGGGNGFSFSRLRPKGARVSTSKGVATGPVGFLRVYDKAFGEIAQGGTRRGANMSVLRVDHPDILHFIRCKTEEGDITNFNISVGITDDFMRAVEADEEYDLINPQDGSVWQRLRAREVFDEIVKHAHRNGEPGVLFLDAANRSNPVPHLYELEATNPCVTGDTLVATPQGWKRADSIREGDIICTVLGTGRVATVEVNPPTPIYRVQLSDGGTIRATAAHQFHARDSRTKFFEPRRLDQLKIGDWVRVCRAALPHNSVPQGTIHLDDDQLYGFLVGILLGDGCYTPRALSKNVVRISTHADEKEWNRILERSFAQVGAEKVSTYVNEGSRSMMMDPKPGRAVAGWVRSLPLTPTTSLKKTIPECYINSNREFLLGLLDGLFSTDGSVDLSSNHPLIRFHTSSTDLARQVRQILLMFGIHGRIAKTIRKRHDIDGRIIRHDHPKYDVIISGESFGRFFEQIHLSHPEKQRRMEEAALRCNFTGGNWAAQVVKIEPAGIEPVVDIYEPHTDTWITEGYVSRGCGEQFLGPYENCCLGSVNLAQHATADGGVDWPKLQETVELSTHFLENVVDANKYVPTVPEIEEAAHRARRIGLGIMGLGDLMFRAGIRYGSPEAEEFAAQVMEFIRYHAMRTSIELAAARGPFPAIQGSIYDPESLQWRPPAPLSPYSRDLRRPDLDWNQIVQGIKRHGIRNAAQTTVAPTGTIATISGCEAYGCEPAFALAYVRHFKDGDEDVELTYSSPLFTQALEQAGLDERTRNRIVQQVSVSGSCQHISQVPASIRNVFVVANDISAEEHVHMQAAIQAFVDNSISKTVNFPEEAATDDVARAYHLAWRLGCKGLTVYVTGSREKVVLETQKTKSAKAGETYQVEPRKPRPTELHGTTYRTPTPLGTAYITINENGNNDPFEVFANVGKAGSDTAAVAEAIGRLISLALRMPSPLTAHERLTEVIDQLVGIGGGRPMGFGPNRVRSLPDAVAQVLARHIALVEAEQPPEQLPLPIAMSNQKADLCPDCGQASVVAMEGCRKCLNCGYSEC